MVGRTSRFALPANGVRLGLTLAYHPQPDDARLLDPNQLTFDTTVLAGEDEVLASDFDDVRVVPMAVYFANVTRTLVPGGAPAPFQILFTNPSESAFQPVRPFLFITGSNQNLDTENLVLEWRNPLTGQWTGVPLTDAGNGPVASFTDAHAVKVAPAGTARVQLRLSATAAVGAGRVSLTADGYVPNDRGYGLGYIRTSVHVR
jgi:hypothetical protein